MSTHKQKDLSTTTQKKKAALDAVCAQIDKEYGTGSVMILGQKRAAQGLEAISTGSLLIDKALGIGGFPRGRIIEIYGPESSGKTTLALGVVAQAQAAGGIAAFIDAEHALDPLYAQKLGVHTADLVVSQPDYGEQALDIAETLIRSGAIDVIVIDSVAALVPKSELEGDMGDVHVGLQARLMSQALRKLAAVVHKSHTVLIFINQIRHNITALPYANKETTTGGNALKFYSSLRLDVRRVESIKKDNVIVGNRVAIKVVKNKVAPPFQRVIVDMIFGRGIDPSLDLLDAGLSVKLIQQAGSWFSFQNTKIAQGRLGVSSALAADRALEQKIRTEIKKRMFTTHDEPKKGNA